MTGHRLTCKRQEVRELVAVCVQVMAELRLLKGPQVGAASARVLDWQLAHPAASADDCRAWLRSQAAPP